MIWTLLIIMQFKHFIADYPLQTPYMLGKFKDKGWVLPLTAHCGVHFLFTFIISFIFTKSLSLSLLFGFIDFFIHFIMDRIKASSKLLGRFEALSKSEFKSIMSSLPMAADGLKLTDRPELVKESQRIIIDLNKKIKSNVLFWWSLGLDQMIHHLTDILIIYLILTK